MANFYWPVRVYWEDTDAGGVVFYANYLKFFERARTEWLRHLGINQQVLRQQTQGMFVVTQAKVDFHAPARLDDRLWVSVALSRRGRASLELLQTAWHAPDGESSVTQAVRQHPSPLEEDTPHLRLCDARISIAWVHTQTLKPSRIPTEVFSVLDTPL